MSVNGVYPGTKYTFTVTAYTLNRPGETAVITTTTSFQPEVFVQLLLSGIHNCQDWVHSHTTEKLLDLTSSLIDVLRSSCLCDYRASDSDHQLFRCSEAGYKDSVTYRARLLTTPNINASSLVSALEEWIVRERYTVIDGLAVSIDSNCTLEIPDMQVDVCIPAPDLQTSVVLTNPSPSFTAIPPEVTSDRTTSDSNVVLLRSLIGVGVALLIVILLFVAITIIVVVLCASTRSVGGKFSISRPRAASDKEKIVTSSNQAYETKELSSDEKLATVEMSSKIVTSSNLAYETKDIPRSEGVGVATSERNAGAEKIATSSNPAYETKDIPRSVGVAVSAGAEKIVTSSNPAYETKVILRSGFGGVGVTKSDGAEEIVMSSNLAYETKAISRSHAQSGNVGSRSCDEYTDIL